MTDFMGMRIYNELEGIRKELQNIRSVMESQKEAACDLNIDRLADQVDQSLAMRTANLRD